MQPTVSPLTNRNRFFSLLAILAGLLLAALVTYGLYIAFKPVP